MNLNNAQLTRRFLLRIVIAFSALSAIVCLSACAKPGQDTKGPHEKVTIAHAGAPFGMLSWVALARGDYLRQGLDVTSHVHSTGKAALAEVLEGKADFATVAETPVLFAVMKGEKISIIATIETSRTSNAIVARKDKGIVTAADLKGKTIGATFGTTSEYYMDAFLATYGVSRKDTKVANMQPEALEAALENGSVDAVSAFSFYLNKIRKQLGDKGITFYNKDIYMETFNMVTTQAYLRKNPETIKKVIRALINAEEYVDHGPVNARKIIADFTGTDIAMLEESWPGTTFRVTLDQSLLLALEDESRWAIEGGLTSEKTIPNYLDYIYLDGLSSVRPKSVRILR